MPFIIPNATDTTGSNRYNALDQAEPDALDFQILGNRATGVISGCGVTAQTLANYTVAVASGYVAISGVVYTVSSSPALSLPAVPSNNRFDLVVARLYAGVASITVVSGPDSASNPTYPPTPSRMTSTTGVPTNTYINPDTDVVLAAVYRPGASTITNAHIVDKRVNVPNTTSLRGDVAPPSALGQNGDFYYKTSVSGSPAIYVKIDGTWQPLNVGAGSGLPIGTVITWVSSGHPGTSEWLECNGDAYPRTGDYVDLYGVLGTGYGAGDGSTTFNIPDFRGAYLRGLPSSGESLGTAYGADTHQITTSQLPVHSHGVGTLAATLNGSHNHSGSSATTGGSHQHNVPFNVDTSEPGGLGSGSVTAGGSSQVLTTSAGSHGHTLSIATDGSHQHSLSGSTGNTGSGSAIPINPRHYPVRYFIKYA